jgi:hypothetical protein
MALFEVTSRNEIIECELSFDQSIPNPERAPVTITTKIEQERIISRDDELKIENPFCRIKLPEFPIDRPWLPQQALTIIDKIRKGPVSEKQLLTLMDLVAEQATAHFQLQRGKFVASTFLGRIVEVSDTRVGLLKKIQNRTFTEEIFVWRAGFSSFSGRT